jgi:glutathione synthase
LNIHEQIIEEAKKHSHDFVMKPQREGGGNLIANQDMVNALTTMSPDERSNYILMRRIEPIPLPTVTLRDSKTTLYPKAIAEFGVFTLFIGNTTETLLNEAGGWLLRTKDESLEDGGVAAGRAVLDSPLLVD